jgi:hypothetical protein
MPSTKSLKTEYQNIMKQARKQPGLEEIMKVYGQYDEFVAQSREYLGVLQSTETFSATTSSQ